MDSVQELLSSAKKSFEIGDFAQSERHLCNACQQIELHAAGKQVREPGRDEQLHLDQVFTCSCLTAQLIERLDESDAQHRACIRILARLFEVAGKFEEAKALHRRANQLARKYDKAPLFVALPKEMENEFVAAIRLDEPVYDASEQTVTAGRGHGTPYSIPASGHDAEGIADRHEPLIAVSREPVRELLAAKQETIPQPKEAVRDETPSSSETSDERAVAAPSNEVVANDASHKQLSAETPSDVKAVNASAGDFAFGWRAIDPSMRILFESARAAFQLGDFEESSRCHQLVLTELEKQNFGDSNMALDCRLSIGSAYVALGDFVQAVREYSKLAVLLEKRLGAGHPFCIGHLYRLARACQRAGRVSEAKAIIARALYLSETYLSPEDDLSVNIKECREEMLRLEQQSLKETIDSAKAMTLQEVGSKGGRKDILDRIFLSSEQRRRLVWLCSAVVACVILFLWLPILAPELVPSHDLSTVTLPDRVFTTADDSAAIRIVDGQYCVLPVDGRERMVPYILVRNDVGGIIQVMWNSMADRAIWVEQTVSGLKTAEGREFYACDSAEYKIIAAMKGIARHLQDYHARMRTFPKNDEEWQSLPWVAYINPSTGRAQVPSLNIYSRRARLGDIFEGVEDTQGLRSYLAHGGTWSDEPPRRPLSISCAVKCSDERLGNGYAAHDFILHATDSSGRLIPARDEGTFLFGYLERCTNLGNLAIDQPAPVRGSARTAPPLPGALVFLSDGPDLLLGLFPTRYAPALLAVVSFSFSFLVWLNRQCRERLTNPRKLPTLLEVVVVVMALLLIASLLRS